jgi:hypothetical protein
MCVCTPAVEQRHARRSCDGDVGRSGRGGGRALRRPTAVLAASPVRLLDDRRGDHRRRSPIGDQRAVVQHDDAVAQLAHDVHLVLDQQDRLVRAFSLRMRSRITGTRRRSCRRVGSSNMKTCGSERHQQRDLELALVARAAGCAGDAPALVGSATLPQDRRGASVDRRPGSPYAQQVEAPIRDAAACTPGARSRARSGSGTAA